MLTSLLIAGVLGCLPGDVGDEKIASANGRFVVELTARSMALREKGAATPRWSLEQRPVGTFVVANSGDWVVELRAPADEKGVHLIVYDSAGKTREVRPLDLMSEEEQQLLRYSDCGLGWFEKVTADGDLVTIEVPQGGKSQTERGARPDADLQGRRAAGDAHSKRSDSPAEHQRADRAASEGRESERCVRPAHCEGDAEVESR